ncbi:MAG: Jag N-terminal domain-containing protein [Campylobacterales bacterium]|nr:Jag N-terminal domain-containing protein [Campylobacterales bacterium]
MTKIEATTLEQAYTDAAKTLKCSVSELSVEIVQVPSKGVFGFFQKSAIIVAALKPQESKKVSKEKPVASQEDLPQQRVFNDTIMPQSFVSDQDDEDEDLKSGLAYTADYDDSFDELYGDEQVTYERDMDAIALEVDEVINHLFSLTCFNIDKIEVSVYDEETLLVEFRGEDAALLIGKEGYRYKALSYMIFNWFNSKYDIQLRLEIAEFLKNQEESVGRYLTSVYENVDRDGRAQTKILDGVLVQIALKELRDRYPEKYVVIRSTKDGLKYIIINDYHNN